jgi:hypothetical protein
MALSPAYSGCPWPVDAACLGDEWADLTPDQQDRALALASNTLRRLTGYRVGTCPITIRPCTQGGCWGYYYWSANGAFNPSINALGQWTNSCPCADGGCATSCEVSLPPPVGGIQEVKVDGVVINPADYQVQSGRYLVYVGDAECPWPQTQNLALPDTEAGTFSITYLNSYPVDNTGAVAAAFLALEFAKACKPKGKCALPRGVTAVVRNGISFDIEAGLFPNNSTGIDVVDAFIQSWNPDGLREAPRVYIPGSSYRTV